jgi:hypothetical protein
VSRPAAGDAGTQTFTRFDALALGTALGLVLLAAAPARATQFPLLYQGTRPLGMGGAYTAVANDAGSLFYNPAGLARVDGFQMDLVNLETETSEGAPGLVKDLQDLEGDDIATATAVVRAHVGEHFRLRANTFPNVVMPGFGFGVLAQANADGEFHSLVNPRMDLDARADTVGVVGLAHGFGPEGRLALGVNAKIARRQGAQTTFTAVDLASDGFTPFDNLDEAETDFAFDLGAMYSPNLPLSPTVGVAALNLTDLDFGTLGTVPYQVNLGVSLNPKLGPVGVTLAADWVDVTNQLATDEDLRKRTNLGAEVRLWKFLAVRGGLHQDYYTAGATVDLWLVKLDLATYGEELGAYGGQREDRRYIARLDFF